MATRSSWARNWAASSTPTSLSNTAWARRQSGRAFCSALTGTFIAANAPQDAWPATTALDPKLALLRTAAEAEPERLFDLAHAARLRALQAQAPNTQRSYASDWRGFVRFCRRAGFNPLPASPPALEAFIEFSMEYSKDVPYQYVLPEAPRPDRKASTVRRAIAAIGAAHRWLQYPDPSAHEDVAHTLKINTRDRSAKTPKKPLPWSAIERALESYGNTLPELRAKALVTVAFSTMLRRSELVALEVADFQPSPDADDGTMRVKRSKTDQAGDGGERYVTAEARRYLEAWLAQSGITEGPIFVRFNRYGEPLPKALHPSQVALIFKEIAARAGFKDFEIEQIAGHSTRIGAAHELGLANYSQVLIQQDGGWKSPHMVGVYTREREVKRGAMAQWSRARAARG